MNKLNKESKIEYSITKLVAAHSQEEINEALKWAMVHTLTALKLIVNNMPLKETEPKEVSVSTVTPRQ